MQKSLAIGVQCKYIASMQSDSALQRLARISLKQDPGEWIGHLRAAGMTWQKIADELSEKVGVPVSRETVRIWCIERSRSNTQEAAS